MQTNHKSETPTFTSRIDFFPRVPLTRQNSYDFYALDDWKPYASSPLCIVKGLIFRIIFVCFLFLLLLSGASHWRDIYLHIQQSLRSIFLITFLVYSLSLSVPCCVHPRTFQKHNWRCSFELFWEHQAIRWRASRGSENLRKYSASQVWVIRR